MGTMGIGWEITAAVLAVLGAYSLVRTVGELFFTPRAVTLCITVRGRQELDSLDILLGEAYRHSLRVRGHAVIVLFDTSLLTGDTRLCSDEQSERTCLVRSGSLHPDRETLALLEKWGAVWYPLPETDGDGGTAAS